MIFIFFCENRNMFKTSFLKKKQKQKLMEKPFLSSLIAEKYK